MLGKIVSQERIGSEKEPFRLMCMMIVVFLAFALYFMLVIFVEGCCGSSSLPAVATQFPAVVTQQSKLFGGCA